MKRILAAAFVATVAGVGLIASMAFTAAVGSPPASGLAPGVVPADLAPLIERYGGTCPGISAPLLAAQLYQESKFDPSSVNASSGAQGLGQFLPGTWATQGIDADGDGAADPFSPADAIASAASYDCVLARDVASLHGDATDLMLAAYNAGPYAVIDAGGVPPFAETQHYVIAIRTLERAFTAVTTTLPTSAAAAKAIAFAYTRLGSPYEWGGTGIDGRFDCSGLTQAAYAAAGFTLPRTSREQWYAGQHITLGQLQPGDLVFYATNLNDPRTIHHVGMYVARGYMIDAPHTGAVIRFDRVDQPDYIGAVRPNRQ